jgi:hypothetical protein
MISANPTNPLRRVDFGWIGESFRLFQKDAGTWVLAIIIFFAASVTVSGGIEGLFFATGHWPFPTQAPVPGAFPVSPFAFLGPTYWTMLGSVSILSIPLQAFFLAGLMRMANKSVRGEPLLLADLFLGGPMILNFIVFGIVYYLATYAGTLVFCLGLFVAIGLLSPGFALLADGETFGSALGKSYNGMKVDTLNASALAFVFFLLYLLSACCVVGALVTVPMGLIIASIAYRDMIGMPGANAAFAMPSAPVGSWPPPPTTQVHASPPPQVYIPPTSVPPPPPAASVVVTEPEAAVETPEPDAVLEQTPIEENGEPEDSGSGST